MENNNKIHHKVINYYKSQKQKAKQEARRIKICKSYQTDVKEALSFLYPNTKPLLKGSMICGTYDHNIIRLIDAFFLNTITKQQKKTAYSVIAKYLKANYNYRKTELKLAKFEIPNQYIKYINKEVYIFKNGQLVFGDFVDPTVRPKQVYSYFSDSEMKLNPDEDLIKFLYNFTFGDIEALKELAKFTAYILSEPLVLKKPIVIFADSSVHNTIINYIKLITDGRITNVPLKNLLSSNGLAELMEPSLNYYFANVIVEDEIPETELQIKRISSIFSGKKVHVTNEALISTLSFENNLPFVFITSDHDKYIKMRTLYGAKEVAIPFKGDIELSKNSAFASFLKTKFAVWGLKCIKENNPCDTYISKISEDDIFKAFFDEFCVFDANEFYSKNKLYELYKAYYIRFYGDKPFSKIMFGKKFAMHANVLSKRHHISKNYYPMCFEGITVNENKVKKFRDSSFNSNFVTSYETFKKYVDNLSNDSLFDNILYDNIPFNCFFADFPNPPYVYGMIPNNY